MAWCSNLPAKFLHFLQVFHPFFASNSQVFRLFFAEKCRAFLVVVVVLMILIKVVVDEKYP